MNKIQRYLGTGALLSTAVLSGCNPRVYVDDYLEGVIKKEAGNVAQIGESNESLLGNETVKINNPTYVLQIQTNEGLYTASIIPRENRTLEALALVIEEGDRVRFYKGYLGEDYFGSDRIGRVPATDVIVLGKE